MYVPYSYSYRVDIVQYFFGIFRYSQRRDVACSRRDGMGFERKFTEEWRCWRRANWKVFIYRKFKPPWFTDPHIGRSPNEWFPPVANVLLHNIFHSSIMARFFALGFMQSCYALSKKPAHHWGKVFKISILFHFINQRYSTSFRKLWYPIILRPRNGMKKNSAGSTILLKKWTKGNHNLETMYYFNEETLSW